MGNEQRNREEKGGRDRQGQDQHRQGDKNRQAEGQDQERQAGQGGKDQHRQGDEGSQPRDDETNLREQNEREKGSGQQGR